MCCCCCFFYSKGRGGTKYCLCWFVVSMVFSIIVIIPAIVIEIIGGGPIPTMNYDVGSKIMYIGNTITFSFSIFCIAVIVRVVENKIIGLVGLLGLLLGLSMSLFTLYAFVHVPSAEEMSPYVQKYYEAYKKAPPFLEFIQNKINAEGDTWGCCGGESFNDFAVSTKRWNAVDINDTHFRFDAPDSCCRQKFRSEKDCGKSLIYYLHQINYIIVNETLRTITNRSDFERVVEVILDRRIIEVNNTPPDVQDHALQDMEAKSIENLNKLEHYRDVKNETIKIFTIGCGRALDDAHSGHIEHEYSTYVEHISTVFYLLIAFGVIKILLNASTIAIYICYYMRFNFFGTAVGPAWIPPGEEGGATTSSEQGGAFENMASLSEGIGSPRMDGPAQSSQSIRSSQIDSPKKDNSATIPSPENSR